ncbi:MAG: biopolymer transporter ExbD [Pirellulales bacterium]|nr:biopolymer transporter ExbD [Pirellulales bacterium]
MALKTHTDEQPSLNLTPMIDIVFLLIIFFMVGTKFSELERKIGLQPPQVNDSGALSAAPEAKTVNVFRDGRIELDNQPVSITELVGQLSAAVAQYPAIGVLVRGDANGRFQSVASVLAACSKAGVRKMGVSVRITNASKDPRLRR